MSTPFDRDYYQRFYFDPRTAVVSRAEARAWLDVSGPFLLTVGSIFNRRCLPELLQATARLVRSCPDLRLEVVGENRTHPWIDVEALADRLGLARHVRLSGFLSDRELAIRYAAADVGVFLSDYEGFGLGVLEAMARGVPVVPFGSTCTRPKVARTSGRVM